MTTPPVKIVNPLLRTLGNTQWHREETDVHNYIFAALNSLDASHHTRILNNSKYLALYENSDARLPGFLKPVQETFSSKLTFNVIKSCIDSVSSKIAKNKPKPEFKTNDADYRLRDRAENLTQFMEGFFYENNLYTLGPDIFIDAALYGTGVISIYSDGEQVQLERVKIDEIYVDDYEGQYRKPKQLFHKRLVFRDTLLARFQDSKDATKIILDCPAADILSDSVADMVEVVEAWYLPSKVSKKQLTQNKNNKVVGAKQQFKGGRHVVCIKNHTLQDEEYTKSYFPFAFFRWSEARESFYGNGLAEELVPIQRDITKLINHIDRHMKFSGLKVFTEAGSEVNPNTLSDNSGRVPVNTYIGQPPIVATWPAVAPEVYSHLENLYRKAYEITGISQMTAHATKEAGVTANSALQTLSDNQTERFQLTGERYEQFFLDITKIVIDLHKDLFADDVNLSIRSVNNGFFKKISWKDVDLDESDYFMKCFPVSAFASSPAAKLQQITEWMQLGAMSPKRAMQLMGDNPDFQSFVSEDTASLTRVQQILDNIIHEGKYISPDIYLDLDEAKITALATLNRVMTQGVPENRLQMIRDWIDELQDLQGIASPSPAPASPMAQAPALPTNQMMPVNGLPTT